MKPGNLRYVWCQIRRQTKDEDSIDAHRIFGVLFLMRKPTNSPRLRTGDLLLQLTPLPPWNTQSIPAAISC